ncbi:YraN family protein [Thalassomonas sp. RHCl1]|uniref:YraN family protein n=1 Tax=Thalassomonas sp. RHCl1 TaxID=2995320 RepID=UPI00248CCE19|nr:YraN family protein [Thalassomonas sp. RHCl1]
MPWTKPPNSPGFNTRGSTTRETGRQTETLAANYLLEQGLTLIGKNFSAKTGEIDLLMREQQVLVFVEVKYRKHPTFGGALAAVSASKQKKIRQTAEFYLQQAGLNAYNTPCRFDVVTLQGSIERPQITWLKNAF